MKRKAEQTERMQEAGEAQSLVPEQCNIKGDEGNIAILLFLYLLQGIPLGLCSSIPMLLQNHGVSYKQQAEFSFVTWPFSLKLFWAPIVDSVYVASFGRRKTWLLPVQYLMGFFMLFMSSYIDRWLGNVEESELNIGALTTLFFILNMLAATQDIVVDGWALTMLKRCNVAHASTCNTVGQTAGFFLGYVLFMAFESPDFCNSYLRSEPSDQGMVTLPGFLYFWGWTFVIVTTLVGVLKHENPENHPKGEDMSIRNAYHILWRTIKLPNMKTMIVILLTAKIGFSASDAVTGLKMVEAGIPKEKIALMAVPLIPLQIILPIFVSKYTAGSKPMDVYTKAYPFRLGFGLLAAFLVWITPNFISHGEVPAYFFMLIVVLYLFHQLFSTCMFVAFMSFFAKVSDPAVGGTYMTFLNTLCNLGGNWPSTAALYFVDTLTFRQCSNDVSNDCSTADEKETCTTSGGVCNMQLDGYYIESLLCVVIGCLWLRWGRRKLGYLQNRPLSTWRVVREKH
ncbi:hypothetical protein QAD02_011610 [Eretmocerus hayati]|uniref:Uncharacterized protein n=1 Tax=Eretmocerus hayati TaxID=131215 RepID=A0ACC2NXN0_9HYME|nr:hypothetical protein QAD02_011610 [Eretmocerus hayati]